MAEARVEDEEESLRETREAGGARRNPRAPIAASASNRAAVPTQHIRERRRPEITILAAEPLATNSWFPGPPGAFPPPPPPAQPPWNASVTVELPPPSYEQVIREKNREQSIYTSSVSSSSSSSSPSSSLSPSFSSIAPHHTTTISTQTDPEVSEPHSSTRPSMRRPPKPPRPSLPPTPKPAEPVLVHTLSLIELDEPDPCCSTNTPTHPFSGEQCGVQTDFTPTLEPLIPVSLDSCHINQNPYSLVKRVGSTRPRPRPRSKALLHSVITEEYQPITGEVKVQTLVRLKDDSSESVFARFTDASLDTTSNKYLQDLFDVFGCGVSDIQSDQHDDHSIKDNKEETLKSCSVSTVAAEPSETITRPEPRPRTQKPKPPIAAKPSDRTLSVEKTKTSLPKQNKPVPAPRPLGKKSPVFRGSSEESCLHRPPSRPPPVALIYGDFTKEDRALSAGVPFYPLKRSSPGDQDQTAAACGKSEVMCPAKPPSCRRPPPPTHTPAHAPAQVVVSSVSVSKSALSPPHRPSESRLLPLRPPPIKGSPQTPAATNQDPGGSRGAKRRPPLPPRPNFGHPVFRKYKEEKLFVALDDTPDVKGQRQDPVSEDPIDQKHLELKNKPQTKEQQSETNTGVRYRAHFAFYGEDDELTFSDGDVITFIEYVNEEWGRGSLNGRTGNFPLNFVQLVQESPAKNPIPESKTPTACVGDGQTGRTLYDFTPESEDELCLKVGDVVSSLEEVDEEWLVGEFDGRRGIVPKNYVQLL
ncbi:SH3 domain-containing protein 19 [Bagarius yarrelli]|uniref:SH3 domain-containing protein 19 n=1 Tax=Bagarius yarrelli TaxID=175774 RepID=A0A556U086_BAGYA|nr:SH3 domain-containing protein 19 [Bagarius yarrelli]